MRYIIYECGICDCYHPWDWSGDCRDNDNRFSPDEYAFKMGIEESDFEICDWLDRLIEDGHYDNRAEAERDYLSPFYNGLLDTGER